MAADRTQHILDAIDGALGDWTVSGDAMRWRPELTEPLPEPRAESMAVSLARAAAPRWRAEPVHHAPLRQPRQNGRGSMHTTSPVYFEWSADLPSLDPWQRRVLDSALRGEQPYVDEMHYRGRGFGRAARQAAMVRAHVDVLRAGMAAAADALQPYVDARLWEACIDPLVDQPDDEDPRARALRLRRQRGTGPGRAPAGQQKRPRSLA